ncbi:gliding motility-associated-like protein, partial [Tenacibaculum adriaticum]
TDSFTYTLCDDDTPTPSCSTATVTVTVTDEGTPVAAADPTAATTSEDTSVTTGNVLTNDTVVDGATITSFDAVSTNGGSVTSNGDGTFVYTPATGFVGTDSFTYTLCDDDTPTPSCSTATVTVTVDSLVEEIIANDDTNAFPIYSQYGAVNALNIADNDLLNGFIIVVDDMNWSIVDGNIGGFILLDPTTGFASIAPGTPAGTYTLTYQVCEKVNPTNCDTAILTIIVLDSRSDNETIIVLDEIVINEDEDQSVVIDIYANDSNLPTSGTLAVTEPVNGIVEITDPNGTPNDPSDDVVTYTPDADFNGTDLFTYTICDNSSTPNCNTGVVKITVNPISDTIDDEAETTNGASVEINVLINDTFTTDALAVSEVNEPENGSVIINTDGTITYTPNDGFVGIDTFVYIVTVTNADGTVTEETAIVTVSVTDPCITVYNEFSPNNDGVNDYLVIKCIDKPEYENNVLEIFNRWGNTVYIGRGYNNRDVVFKGISNGRANINRDEQLPVGTYFYVLDLGDGSPVRKGWIYINR